VTHTTVPIRLLSALFYDLGADSLAYLSFLWAFSAGHFLPFLLPIGTSHVDPLEESVE